MRVIMVAVVSKNGYITDESLDPHAWSSREDKIFFENIKSKHNTLIMGKKTYDSALKFIKNDEKNRIVITHSKDAPNTANTHFFSGDITKLLESIHQNVDTALLLGGGEIYKTFLDLNLIDEIQLTVEPLEFKKGIKLFSTHSDIPNTFKLTSSKILNNSGTILYTYTNL